MKKFTDTVDVSHDRRSRNYRLILYVHIDILTSLNFKKLAKYQVIHANGRLRYTL